MNVHYWKCRNSKIKGSLINATLVCRKAHLLRDWQKIIFGKTSKLHGTVKIWQDFSSLLSYFEKATSVWALFITLRCLVPRFYSLHKWSWSLFIYFCLPSCHSQWWIKLSKQNIVYPKALTPVSQQGGKAKRCHVLCIWNEVHCRCHLFVDSGTEDGWGHICIASLELYSVHWSPFVRRESSTVSKIDCTALVLALISDHAFHIDYFCAVLACWQTSQTLFKIIYHFH